MASQDHNKPNIVFILSDDQGAWAMGCSGNQELRTPNLDRLAAKGMRFSNFYCACPVCSPARATILTGKMPSEHGVHDWIRAGNLNTDNDYAIQYLEHMTTYTEILANEGYECALSGKWHLGDSMISQKGFNHWYTIGGGGCKYYQPDIVQNGELKKENRYITDLITEDALAYLENSRDNQSPFYLSIHYTAPHGPWEKEHHPKAIYETYDGCCFNSVPKEPLHPWQINTCAVGIDDNRRREILQGYYTAITAMDKGIGQIIDKIDDIGIRENTLIVFTSDNGMNIGHHGIWGKGNGTFPQNMFDTSVKVPAIISRPGHIPENVIRDDMLSHYDFFPTLLDYLQIPYSTPKQLPGKSFVPLLQGKALNSYDSVVIYDEYGPVRMIRSKDWKYIHRYPYGPHELYDMINDKDEKNNLIHDLSKELVINKMKRQLDQWFVQYASSEVDGVKEMVYGKGQINHAGIHSQGCKNYADDWWYIEERK